MVRAFVALELSKDVQDKLTLVQERIRSCKARLTLVDPKNIHITVKFLGEVDEKKILNVMDVLRICQIFSVSCNSWHSNREQSKTPAYNLVCD